MELDTLINKERLAASPVACQHNGILRVRILHIAIKKLFYIFVHAVNLFITRRYTFFSKTDSKEREKVSDIRKHFFKVVKKQIIYYLFCFLSIPYL